MRAPGPLSEVHGRSPVPGDCKVVERVLTSRKVLIDGSERGASCSSWLSLVSCVDSDSRRVFEVQSVCPDGRTLIVTVRQMRRSSGGHGRGTEDRVC
jgi:hypothetical protein